MMQGKPASPPDPAAIARRLLEEIGTAALATLGPTGAPFASYVTTAAGSNGSPILLLSQLAVHTRNIAADPRASLLLVREADAGRGRLTAERLTVVGEIARAGDESEARSRFLRRHPDAAPYAGFADFAFYGMTITGAHLVAGFGVIADLEPGDLLSS